MTAATVSHWTMANLVSVYKGSPILCAALGSGIGFCRALQLYMPRSQNQMGWSDAQNAARRSWQSPTALSIVLIVPARCTVVRKQQVTGNGGRIRTNRDSKSRIYSRFPAWQSWRWIAIPIIAQKSRSNCPHGGTCHGYKTLLHSSEATGPKFYTTAQFSVWGTKFLLLVKWSKTVVCDDPASNGFVPQKRMGRWLWQNLSVLPHQRGVCCCTVAAKRRWIRCGNYNMPIWSPSKSRGVENPTVSIQNTMKRFRTPTSRNPVAERRKAE